MGGVFPTPPTGPLPPRCAVIVPSTADQLLPARRRLLGWDVGRCTSPLRGLGRGHRLSSEVVLRLRWVAGREGTDPQPKALRKLGCRSRHRLAFTHTPPWAAASLGGMHRRLHVRAGTSVLCALGVRVTTERGGPARFAEPARPPPPRRLFQAQPQRPPRCAPTRCPAGRWWV